MLTNRCCFFYDWINQVAIDIAVVSHEGEYNIYSLEHFNDTIPCHQVHASPGDENLNTAATHLGGGGDYGQEGTKRR